MFQLDESTAEGWWDDNQENVLSITSLFVLHHIIFNGVEKKLIRSMLALYKKVPCVTLVGPVVWFPERFVSKMAPAYDAILDRKSIDALLSFRSSYLSQKVSLLSKEVQNTNLKVSAEMSYCLLCSI